MHSGFALGDDDHGRAYLDLFLEREGTAVVKSSKNRLWHWTAGLLLLTLVPAGASAQNVSYDRDEALQAFQAADNTLNELWGEAREFLPDDAFVRLLEEQRAWLERRDATAAYYASLVAGPSESDVTDTGAYHQARTDLTALRNDAIRGWIRTYEGSFPSEWDGVWVNGSGGTMIIKQHGDGWTGPFSFHIDVSPTSILWAGSISDGATHSGTIFAVAVRNGNLGRFAYDAPRNGDTWITFHWQAPHIEVITVNGYHFHGIYASFQGRYVRLRDLSQRDIDGLGNTLPSD